MRGGVLFASLFSGLLFVCSVAVADDQPHCWALINGERVELQFDSADGEYLDNTTFREIFFSNWDGSCPSYVVLKALTPELTAEERSVFCLEFTSEEKQYPGYAVGERDAYGVCKSPGKFCQAVNASKEEALAVAGVVAGLVGGATTTTTAAGVTAVAHSSGAAILTGTSGYIAGTLGSVATGVVSVLTAPFVVAGATASVVAIGTAVYVCQ